MKYGWFPWVWGGVYLLMLLSLLTPFSVLWISFIMIPVLLLFMRLPVNVFAITYGAILLIACLIAGSLAIVPLLVSLFFSIPAIVMGILYRKNWAARQVISSGIFVVIFQLLLALLLLTLLDLNPIGSLGDFMRESVLSVPEALRPGLTNEMIDLTIRMITQLIPVYIVMFAFFYVVITHVLSRLLLRRQGIALAKMRPIREWMLPRSLLWYYIVVMGIQMFMVPEPDSMLFLIILNASPILTVAFIVQAISFMFFLVHVKKVSLAFPIVAIVLAFFTPQLVALLGVFDIAFQIRQRFLKS